MSFPRAVAHQAKAFDRLLCAFKPLTIASCVMGSSLADIRVGPKHVCCDIRRVLADGLAMGKTVASHIAPASAHYANFCQCRASPANFGDLGRVVGTDASARVWFTRSLVPLATVPSSSRATKQKSAVESATALFARQLGLQELAYSLWAYLGAVVIGFPCVITTVEYAKGLGCSLGRGRVLSSASIPVFSVASGTA